uniref:Methyltransferase type 11 domain-containing protein n=1 Tax=Fabrea salina TaxID=342563 RepID=A0A7S3MR92_9CILI|mmetsp:Transcript_2047/g.3273  ORF Transcript_2047/g.3273 Transcript_2047/m.3273 type:complete len:310 (+) Transcript_2047:21-950(+)
MSQEWIDQLYIYEKDYINLVLEEARRIKREKGECDYKDFEHLDVFHPAGNAGLDLFLESYKHLPQNITVLDVGSGIGGPGRYVNGKTGWRIYGFDYLQHYVDAAKEITEYSGQGQTIEYHHGDILSDPLPENAFDMAMTTAVFMYIPEGVPGFRNIYKALKPGAIFYWEDYYLLKERDQLNAEERKLLEDFPTQGVRTKNTLLQEMQGVGFELVEWCDFGKEWSEFAWNRAERFLTRHYSEDSKKPLKGELFSYGRIVPQILKDLKHYTPQQIKEKWPVTDRELDSEQVIFNKPEFIGVSRVVFKKPEA